MIEAVDPMRRRRPHVLWVNQFASLPKDGGGTRHFELGRELVRRGWRVTIIASDLHLHRRTYTRRAGENVRAAIAESVDGVDIQWVWAASYRVNNWRRAWNWLSFSGSVGRICQSISRPDVVIGSSPQLFSASSARRVARRFSVPFVFEVRDLWPESLVAAGGRRGPAYKVLDHLARNLYRDADRILVLARGTQDYLIERGIAKDKFLHIPNGVDIHLVKPGINNQYTDDKFKLVYAGAHGPANGLEQILDAAERLRSFSNVRFLLVGDGPIKADLMAEADRRGLGNVEFQGAVSKERLVEIFLTAEAGLMTLRDTPLFSFGVSPNKLFDYLSAALPVICNVPGEVAQMLAESGGGLQVTDGSGAALAAGIRKFMSLSCDERRRMGAAGRDWVRRDHSREVLGERLDFAMRELIKDRISP